MTAVLLNHSEKAFLRDSVQVSEAEETVIMTTPADTIPAADAIIATDPFENTIKYLM